MKREDKFLIGTIVRLKSGGPDMTVQTAPDNGKVWAQWFAGKKMERSVFPTESLDLVEGQDTSKK